MQNRGPGGITWEANPNDWGGRPAIDRVEMQVLDDQARVTALQSGQIDSAVQVSYEGAQQLQRANKKVWPIRTANHRYLNMNVTKEPFNDVRVRQAIALALDRPALARGLWGPYAEVGNDSPMLAGHLYTAKVAQRRQNLERARSLLQAAAREPPGHAHLLSGLRDARLCAARRASPEADRDQLRGEGLHQRAVLRRQQLRRSAARSHRGSTPTSASSITADVRAPTTYLNAGLKSGGVWNSARYRNTAFDRMLANFLGAPILPGNGGTLASSRRSCCRTRP